MKEKLIIFSLQFILNLVHIIQLDLTDRIHLRKPTSRAGLSTAKRFGNIAILVIVSNIHIDTWNRRSVAMTEREIQPCLEVFIHIVLGLQQEQSPELGLVDLMKSLLTLEDHCKITTIHVECRFHCHNFIVQYNVVFPNLYFSN